MQKNKKTNRAAASAVNDKKKKLIKKGITAVYLILMLAALGYGFMTAQEDRIFLLVGAAIVVITAVYNLLVYGYPRWLEVIITLSVPALIFMLTESITHPLYKMWQGPVILNLILYYTFFLFLMMATGNIRFAAGLMAIFTALVGLTNYFVLLFRSGPIQPWDIYSIKIATTVADNFTYTLNVRACIVLLMFFSLLSVVGKVRLRIRKGRLRLVLSLVFLAFLAVFVKGVQTDAVANKFHTDKTLFTPTVYYRNNGLFLSYLINIRYLNIEQPKGYSVKTAQELIPNDIGSGGESQASYEKPNIIVVMNEALSDLRILGDYDTNVEVTPFMDSLRENTRRGWMFSSVKGGNTANTELEFLTNSTLQFLPVGSVAYQQFIRSSIPSIASQLSDYGYTSIAMHPYNASGWNRNTVYDLFGFDEKYFLPSFKNPEIIRKYVSDRTTFDKIIERYENKAEDERLFFFDVTMQNHGSYTKSFENFTPDVKISNAKGPKTYLKATEQYLSLVKITDEAFEDLVNYFKGVDDPTIIIMFGDHQPADYAVAAVNEQDQSTIEGQQEQYKVNYIMWANYDIPESEGDITSANYLSIDLLQTAGVPLTPYQTYLTRLKKEVPVITALVSIDKDGLYHERGASDIYDRLYAYSVFQYNDIADTKNRIEKFFK